MRGINQVVLSGHVGTIKYCETGNRTPTCSFHLASDRYARGTITTVWVKINVYGEGLVSTCKHRLHKGLYVIVEGELMNRDSPRLKELVEVRTRELIFLKRGESDG